MNENTTTQKIGMAERFMIAMFSPKEYKKILAQGGRKLIPYLLLLLLLVSAIQNIIPTAAALAARGGIRNIILNEIPDFSLKDGIFRLAETYEKDDSDMGVWIRVDTSKKKYTEKDIPEGYVEVLLVSKTNMVFYNEVSGLGGVAQELRFKDYKDWNIDNAALAQQTPVFYGILVFTMVLLYIGNLVKYCVMAVFYTLVLYLLAKVIMPDATFGGIYRVALYAQSTGAVVSAVTYCLGIPILVLAGSSFGMLITVMIMNRALMAEKTDV